jgi:hypothetical protein
LAACPPTWACPPDLLPSSDNLPAPGGPPGSSHRPPGAGQIRKTPWRPGPIETGDISGAGRQDFYQLPGDHLGSSHRPPGAGQLRKTPWRPAPIETGDIFGAGRQDFYQLPGDRLGSLHGPPGAGQIRRRSWRPAPPPSSTCPLPRGHVGGQAARILCHLATACQLLGDHLRSSYGPPGAGQFKEKDLGGLPLQHSGTSWG